MNLTDIAKRVLKEDTWGNNPSAAGSMSPGRAPTAVQPPAAQSGNTVDISNLFKNFKLELEKQEDASVKKLVDNLKKSFLKKTVQVKASKGSVGQIEKEYDISVNDIDVRYMKDKYYVVFTGKEGSANNAEYYLDDSIIQVNPATKASAAPASGLKNIGGVIPLKPTSQMAPTAKNILPQG